MNRAANQKKIVGKEAKDQIERKKFVESVFKPAAGDLKKSFYNTI